MACLPFWNSWTPCTKAICGKMWKDIYKYTWMALMPWNLFQFLPWFTYVGYMMSGFVWLETYNQNINVAYGVHCVYLLIRFILEPIFRNMLEKDNPPELYTMWRTALDEASTSDDAGGGVNVFDLFTYFVYAHTWCFLSTLWGLTVTRYPEGYCCCKPISAARFFAFWMFVAILFNCITLYYHIVLVTIGASYYIASICLTVFDCIILIPIVHWSAHAAIITAKKGQGVTKNDNIPEA